MKRIYFHSTRARPDVARQVLGVKVFNRAVKGTWEKIFMGLYRTAVVPCKFELIDGEPWVVDDCMHYSLRPGSAVR